MLALDDIVVLDLSHALAGPFASTLLGDYGAEILKIEPLEGEISHSWGPPFYGSEPGVPTARTVRGGVEAGGPTARTVRDGVESAYFVNLNRNKKSIALDLKHPEGRRTFLRLAEHADIVLENMRVGTVARLGIDYDAVRRVQPRVIYCSISGFGQDGPYRDRAALDLIVQAESGMISVTGDPGSHGVRAGVSIADLTAGMYAAFGIMTALHARQKTGRGQFLDVSMLEGQLAILSGAIGAYLADRIVPQPMGTAYGMLLPYQTFRTRTRDIAIGIGSDKLWRTFCPLIGLPELTDDARYATNAKRNTNRTSLIAVLQEKFLTNSYEAWEAILLPAGVPIGAINRIDDVVEHPQAAARGALVECQHPLAGAIRMVGPPVRMSETPGAVRRPAPLIGEHTDEVLRDMVRMSDDEIAGLREAGVIGGAAT